MNRATVCRMALAGALAVLVVAPDRGGAVLPLVAGMGRQIVQNMLISGVKGQLIGSLSVLGCKGATITGLIARTDIHGVGHGGIGGGALSPGFPGAGAVPGGRGPPLPGPAGNLPMPDSQIGDPRSLRAARGAPEIPTLPPGVDPRSMTMEQMMAIVQQHVGSRLPASQQMTPEQVNQAMEAMNRMQQAMAQPLSREETLGVFDELAQLGVLTPAMQSEARDCILLAPPQASTGIGQTGAMFKTIVLPQLRSMREQLAQFDADQQDRLAIEIVDALNSASDQDRKAFIDGFGLGFFPPPVVDAVRAELR